MFDFLPAPLNTAIPFLIVLGVLVFFHELGHYLAARWRGVFVEAFSIGFGQSLLTWRDRHGTLWKVSWIPLGGYVKLHGQERPEDVSEDVRRGWLRGRTFHEKSVLSRAIIVAAGPLANFVLAAVVFAGLFATAGQPIVPDVVPPVVGQVKIASAADHAGLRAGDRIDAIDGQPITRFDEIRDIVAAHPETHLQIRFSRDGEQRTVDVTTDMREDGGQRIGVLGIGASTTVTYKRLPLPEAIVAGVAHTWDVGVQTLAGLWQVITLKIGASALGGPLGIASLAGQAAEQGPATLVNLIGFLSVNLGLVNLFPIPVLDGGHLLFFLFEAVRGKPLPPRAIEYGFRAGLAVLVGLFVFVTTNDLTHLGVLHWVRGLLG